MRYRFAALFILLALPSVSAAAEGVLFITPARATYGIGESFEVVVRANTDGVAANAAEADISYNPAALSVERVSTQGSVLSLWPTPVVFSNESGTLRFSGTAGEGFAASDAALVTITFKAKSVLPGDVHIDSGALLLNDARATNIITGMRSALYTIVARETPPAPELQTVVATSAEPELTPTPEVKGVSVQVPAIMGYDDRVAIGGRIVLQGTASPNSALSVFLQFEDDAPKESTIQSTNTGSFTYVAAEPAERGVYRAWVQVSSASETFASDKVVIVARPQGFAAAVETMTPMLGLALPYLLLLVAVGGIIGYLFSRKTLAKSLNSGRRMP